MYIMKNKYLYLLGGAVVGGIFYASYKFKKEPKFDVVATEKGKGTDDYVVEGTYSFGHIKNAPFNNSENYTEKAKTFLNYGWSIFIDSTQDSVKFELMKNNQRVKTLKEFKNERKS